VTDQTEVAKVPQSAATAASGPKSGFSMPMIVAAVIMFLAMASYFVNGILLLLDLGVLKGTMVGSAVRDGALTPQGQRLVLAIFSLLFGALALVFFIGFVLKRKWGWSGAMTWTALVLAFNLVAYYRGEPRYLSMLASVVVLLVLNQASVHRVFGVGEG
jgi:hypothetical protein